MKKKNKRIRKVNKEMKSQLKSIHQQKGKGKNYKKYHLLLFT